MTTILNVAAYVSKVHQQGIARVVHSLIELADLQGDNRFYTRRKGRVTCCERVVEIESSAFWSLEKIHG